MAKFYIYRNLHRGKAFSIRYRGVVIDRLEHFTATDVEFRVSEAGRQRVLTSGHRGIHAYVVCSAYEPTWEMPLGFTEVRYNPHKMSTFQSNGSPVHTAPMVLFHGGRCYLYAKHNQNL